MYSVKCLICNQEFISEHNGRQLSKLNTHLKNIHNMTVEQYVLQYEYNNQPPLCACGCGNKVKFHKWKFKKYYKDHKNKMSTPYEVKQKISKSLLKNNRGEIIEYKITENELQRLWEMYKTKDYNLQQISNIAGIDVRTIKKYWILANITDNREIRRYARLHKLVWSKQGEKNKCYQKIDDNLLINIYQCLLKSKNTFTIKKLKSMFGIKNSSLVLYKRLTEKFGKDEINKYLKSGLSSKPENEFYYILVYYFGEKNVKKQFRIKGYRKFYDFCLFDKLIIEWDGEYWHKLKKDIDKEKEDIAINKGYYFYRVLEKESKKIDILIKIKEIVDEIQIKRN